ncbi:sortase [Cryobacterium sp. SO2]|uniref:sortase domain-containing protein n=1 Tax=Cryobacterium sp. SO2 TaxID=1897060 RepID=UPI00223CFABD|nr:sortase [Cryobacterium sp. SO2]WEO78049.1 sortase [Cryobacterium sp. SO2]
MSLFGWRTPARTLPGRRAGSPGHGTDRQLRRFPGRPAGPAPVRFGTVAAIGLVVALFSGCGAHVPGSAPAGAVSSGTAAAGPGRAATERGGADPVSSARAENGLAGVGASRAGVSAPAPSGAEAAEADSPAVVDGTLGSLGGPAAAAMPGGLPDRAVVRIGTGPTDGLTGSPTGNTPPPSTLWPPVPPALAAAAPRAPEPPRASADLAGQPAPVSAPVRVTVDALEIDMPIEPVGLADDGALALPANPAVAAWYRYGPGPGSAAGATVVAAHVDSLVYDLGPFARLADAPAGTEIVVHTSDGSAHRYTIASINTVEKQAVPWAGVFDRAGEPRLTLVTCGGEFDYEARRYLSNVIVTAVPAP